MYENLTLISIAKAQELKGINSDVASEVKKFAESSITDDLRDAYKAVALLTKKIAKTILLKDISKRKAS